VTESRAGRGARIMETPGRTRRAADSGGSRGGRGVPLEGTTRGGGALRIAGERARGRLGADAAPAEAKELLARIFVNYYVAPARSLAVQACIPGRLAETQSVCRQNASVVPAEHRCSRSVGSGRSE